MFSFDFLSFEGRNYPAFRPTLFNFENNSKNLLHDCLLKSHRERYSSADDGASSTRLFQGRHSGRKNADPWASLIWKPIRSINIIIEFKHICLEILKFSNEILVFGYIKPLYENDLILIKFDIHIVKFSTRRHSEIKNHSCKWFFDPLGTLILPQNQICYSGIDGGRRSSKNLWRPAAFPI